MAPDVLGMCACLPTTAVLVVHCSLLLVQFVAFVVSFSDYGIQWGNLYGCLQLLEHYQEGFMIFQCQRISDYMEPGLRI